MDAGGCGPGAGKALVFHAHDVSQEDVGRLLSEAELAGKAVLVAPVFDTIKLVQAGIVQETLDRAELRWPRAWACRPHLAPLSDPPSSSWFIGAVALESAS